VKAIIVGDNLIDSRMFLSRCQPLREAGYAIQAFDWLAEDRNDLSRRNLNVEKYGPEAELPPDGLQAAVPEAAILITHFAPLARASIEAGRQLKVIGVARAGWENIDVGTATAQGIPVVHIVGRNANAVAEHTVGLLLAEMRNIARAHWAMKDGEWYNRYVDPHTCFELSGKAVGLVGFGAVGRLVARRLSGFDLRLLVCDPFVAESTVQAAGGELVALADLMRQADIVSLHTRLSPETQGLIGQRELALMKPTAYLVNTARAGLIDEAALLETLQSKRIAGAALDVFWQEPLPPGSPWLELDNVTLCAHLAGTTLDALHNTIDLVIEEVLAYLRQGKVDRIVNPEALDVRQTP